MTPAELKYGADGLLTVVVQHHRTGRVLMVGHANQEAVQRTVESRNAWFFSRSRQSLWMKGESSGNVLDVKGLRVDCDGDALLYLAEPVGPTCHTGNETCFFNRMEGFQDEVETEGEAAGELWDTIRARQAQGDASTSYVAKLISQGVDRAAKKVGEEAGEVIIAAKNADPVELSNEMADLWFHTYVLLAQQGMSPADVWAALRARRR